MWTNSTPNYSLPLKWIPIKTHACVRTCTITRTHTQTHSHTYTHTHKHTHTHNDLNMCRNVRPNFCIRGNMYKLEKQRVYLDIRKYFFTCIVNVCNSLANEIVCCKNINMFIRKLHFCKFLNFFKGHICIIKHFIYMFTVCSACFFCK